MADEDLDFLEYVSEKKPTLVIPKLSKAEFARRLARIKPVIRKGKKLHYIEDVSPITAAYTWDPKLLDEAVGLTPITKIRTLHSWGHYSMFKPSIGEVLSQIPADLVDKVSAFEITKSPENADDLNREKEALNAGFHVAETTLYHIDEAILARERRKPKTPFAKAILGDDDPFEDADRPGPR